MKKLIALLLAALLLSLGASAFAEDSADDPSTWTSEATTFTFTKTYVKDLTAETLVNATTYPAETLTFAATPAEGNPTGDPGITVNNNTNTYTANGVVNTITVNVPSYTKVGEYEYTIKEAAGSTQGVGYDTTSEIDVAVLVTYNYGAKKLDVEANVKQNDEGVKEKDLFNQYNVGSLTVSKAVEGNLGDKNKVFDIDVVFTADKNVWTDITYSGGTDVDIQTIAGNGWTGAHEKVTIHLKDTNSVTFNNIPVGVTYTVVEDSRHTSGSVNTDEGYTATYANSDNTTTTTGSGTIEADDSDRVTITNNKSTDINTGITLDTLPYIIALAVVAIGVVLFIVRRRRREDD